MEKSILCVAQGHRGDWQAFCVDFDIAVEGPSFEDVQAKLNEAVTDYVSAAMAESPLVRAKLLNRRAPVLVRAQWAARILIANLSHSFRNRGGVDVAQFPVHCAA
jgi:hypothetical protein